MMAFNLSHTIYKTKILHKNYEKHKYEQLLTLKIWRLIRIYLKKKKNNLLLRDLAI